MIAQLAQAFAECQSTLARCRLFLACSGGRDSLALAYACHALYQEGKIDVLPTLLHVHHGWQKANDEWADLVANWAKQHEFDCQVLPVHLPKNSETHARKARYQALASVMNDGDVLMLAHHANDQAETMLTRLIAGTGVQGLSAMKTWQNRHIDGKTIRLWRPWLGVLRDDISHFAKSHHLPYVDDPTNVHDDHVRGKLRNHIMPILTTINPKAVQNIVRTGQVLADSAQLIDEVLSQTMTQSATPTPYASQAPYYDLLGVEHLLCQSAPMQSAMIHRYLGGFEATSPTKRLVDDVLALARRQDGDHQTQLFWQAGLGHMIGRYQGFLYRHRMDAWACLSAVACDGVIIDDKIVLKQHGELSLIWQIPVAWHGQVQAKKVAKDTKITFNKSLNYKTLYGKKLVQTLKIPVHLRDNLWLIYHDDVAVLLITLGRAWCLVDNELPTKLGACFA